jgi:hypothetical protein
MDHDIFMTMAPLILQSTGVDVMSPAHGRDKAKVLAECKRVKEVLSSADEVCKLFVCAIFFHSPGRFVHSSGRFCHAYGRVFSFIWASFFVHMGEFFCSYGRAFMFIWASFFVHMGEFIHPCGRIFCSYGRLFRSYG